MIATPADLNSIGHNSSDWDNTYKLISDINMSASTGHDYIPIGNQSIPFTGVFDGNGHVITNFKYAVDASTAHIGLFGYTSNAIIKNLGLSNAQVIGNGSMAGALIGKQIQGTDVNCYSTGFVSVSSSVHTTYAGTLIGYLDGGNVNNCFSQGSVDSACYLTSGFPSASAGGLIGYQSAGSVSNCYSTSSTSASANSYTYSGGLIASLFGYSGTSIRNCYSTGQPAAYSPFARIGGFIGSFNWVGSITSSFWDIESSNMINGFNSGSLSGVSGKTKIEMQMRSTFTNAGWDFVGETANGSNDYWQMPANDYPRLFYEDYLLIGDLNNDGRVDSGDLSILVAQWLCIELNHDLYEDSQHIVNFLDFNVFAQDWHGDYQQLADFLNEWLAFDAYSADIAGEDDYVDLLDFAAFAENWKK